MSKQKYGSYEERFTKEPMWPLILSMAMPMVAAQLVNLLYSIVDRIYIGHIPEVGTTALAGVGICNTFIILISAFSSIVGGGGAPLASIALGRGEKEKAEDIMNQGMRLLILFTIGLTAVGFPCMEKLLRACGASDATLPYALSYMRIYLCGTLFVLFALGLSPFLNTVGHAKISFAAVAVGAVTNIVLDPVLIFGMKMGTAGAALATIISQAVSAAVVVRYLTGEKAVLRLHFGSFHMESRTVREIFSLGVSPFVMTSTESLIGFVMNGQLAKYGDIYVSALAVMQSGMSMISVPLQGFGQGTVPILSFSYGHGSPDRLKECIRDLMIVSFAYNLAMAAWMVFCPRMAASLFTQDEELISTVAMAMPWFMSGMSIFGIQRAAQNTFVACRQPKISLFFALLRKVFLLVPLVYIMQVFVKPGYIGIYLAESIADASAALTCAIVFRHRLPKILREAAGNRQTPENALEK